ncbi:hypothetical protein FRX31_028330 [Thalictrum thalictroides]|uniref:Uncharacterized protein n=1 Tax=Thalictrum thalictroides TaxID=46969 RepID=A0A7J6VAH2_THATH|nr:hypothetical protein FRX31_028330 [Thalictrum thalictroides]
MGRRTFAGQRFLEEKAAAARLVPRRPGHYQSLQARAMPGPFPVESRPKTLNRLRNRTGRNSVHQSKSNLPPPAAKAPRPLHQATHQLSLKPQYPVIRTGQSRLPRHQMSFQDGIVVKAPSMVNT